VLTSICWSRIANLGGGLLDGGHMHIAAAAYDRLDPGARSKVDTLIKNPDYSQWADGVADADRDRFTFVHASAWADNIKEKVGYTDSRDGPRSHNAA
jgi:hypothetical protein